MFGIVGTVYGADLNVNANANLQVGNNNSGNSNGIGQELSQQIAEKRTEYRSGNFTTSLGQFLNVHETVLGMLELREGNISVRTRLNLTKVENNESKLEVNLSNGRKAEIKVMPSTASQIALEKLKLNLCNETNNCTIELKEVGNGNQTKVEYQLKAQKDVKVLGLFRAKMNIETNVNAETKEVISSHAPWWSSISTNAS
jgi:hypothetical protein